MDAGQQTLELDKDALPAFHAAPCSALFVRTDSIYKRFGLDCWDAERDATNYRGDLPVITHPPCRTWSRLAPCVTRARPGEKELAPWAVDQVQKWGGVLEHPAGSKLWDHCKLPPAGGLPDAHGGICIEVDQWHWGHWAKKPTRLYIAGATNIPAMPIRSGRPTHCVTQGKNVRIGHPRFLPRIPDWEREATPELFARWLVEIAASCKQNAEATDPATTKSNTIES